MKPIVTKYVFHEELLKKNILFSYDFAFSSSEMIILKKEENIFLVAILSNPKIFLQGGDDHHERIQYVVKKGQKVRNYKNINIDIFSQKKVNLHISDILQHRR